MVAALLRQVLLPPQRLGRGNHLLVATGVLLERRSYASVTGHGLILFVYEEKTILSRMRTPHPEGVREIGLGASQTVINSCCSSTGGEQGGKDANLHRLWTVQP
jgi:hypothetical protein